MNPRTDDMDRLAEAERWANAQTFRHGGRRAEDRGIALAVHAGLQMVRDPGPDTIPTRPAYLPMNADGDPLSHALADQCQLNSAEGCADTSEHPRIARKQRMPEGGLIASLLPVAVVLLAVVSLAILARR